MNLNLGCGKKHPYGYVNIDLEEPADRIMDITKLDYKKGSIKDIYCLHTLEHLPANKIQDILKDWYSLLEKGGTIKISVPDFTRITMYYWFYKLTFNKKMQEEVLRIVCAGGPDFKENQYHKIQFDEWFLKDLLKKTGFKKVKKINLGCVHSLSLTVKAIK